VETANTVHAHTVVGEKGKVNSHDRSDGRTMEKVNAFEVLSLPRAFQRVHQSD
jgi:hypothetical protein